ncbi:serine--tRNA ligase [Candidatus Riesia sp. GBBU]|nr:serine--tRNA ligase [Candidatus Riesia sp. GBBU]
MLSVNNLRHNTKFIAQKLSRRGFILEIKKVKSLETKRKKLQIKIETLQKKRNFLSEKIEKNLVYGEKNLNYVKNKVKKIRKDFVFLKKNLLDLKKEIRKFYSKIPNIPDDSVPTGINKSDNVEIVKWGKIKKYDFDIKDHVSLGKINNRIDFCSASQISGKKFAFIKGDMAKLYRALSQFMINLHTEEHKYIEIYVPYLVKKDALYGSGQLPKFKEELIEAKIPKHGKLDNFFLIPTSEVSLVNLARNKIFSSGSLPIKLVTNSPCFRSEIGSYGKSSKGIIRMHQFDKVELIQIVNPENSMESLEEITSHAENVLKFLELPYRKVMLCTGEIGFSSCKTYDLEAWFPSKNKYCEVSSCSNTRDFQSRRIMARFFCGIKKTKRFVHILNGSGLAIGRVLASIMENYQEKNGWIKIPKILRSYMNGNKYIKN